MLFGSVGLSSPLRNINTFPTNLGVQNIQPVNTFQTIPLNNGFSQIQLQPNNATFAPWNGSAINFSAVRAVLFR